MINPRKVVVIGDGAVGSSIAFTLANGHAVNEIVIVDVNKDKAEGDVLDIADGMSFLSVPKLIKAGGYEDAKDAHIIIITAGAAQKPGETRLDLLHKNAAIMTSIVESLKPHLDPEAIVIVVSNPCDVLSYLAYKKLGLPSSQVFGSGTVLDTSRLKTAISEDTGIDPRNVHTFVVGEHGDSEVAVWSATSIGGLSILDYSTQCPECNLSHLDELHDKVRDAAYQIIAKKGATNYAVALAVSRIVSSSPSPPISKASSAGPYPISISPFPASSARKGSSRSSILPIPRKNSWPSSIPAASLRKRSLSSDCKIASSRLFALNRRSARCRRLFFSSIGLPPGKKGQTST